MAFETEGTLHKVFDTESKTDSFQAREFVIKHDGNYPQFIKFQLTQDRCDLINKFNVGENIKVSFDLRGREWNEKYFTNLNAWKIENASTPSEEPSGAVEQGGFDPIGDLATSETSQSIKAEDFDDLPF